MSTPGGRRPAGQGKTASGNWLLAVIGALIVVLVVFVVVLWAKGGVSCAQDLPTSATVTLPAPSTSTTSSTSTTEPPAVEPLAFDGAMAMSHVKALAQDIGPRESGTQAEDDALDYATAYLQSLGYQVETNEVALPGGLTTHDVQAVKQGESDLMVVVAGHIDSKAGAPGANDDASGVAVVLELARDLRDARPVAGVEFVVFAAEEMTDSDPDHHHYGSRQFVQGLTIEQRASLVGMVAADMVGYGSEFTVRTLDRGPQTLKDLIKAYSTGRGLAARYVQDTSTYGSSDEEPFELAGYPAVWLEWRQDPTYHTARDTYSHCDPTLVQRTGEMLLGFLYGLSQSELQTLAAARSL